MPTIHGLNQFVEQPTRRRWTKNKGLTITREFRGPPTAALVTAKEVEMQTLGALTVDSVIGKGAVVTAEFTDAIAVSTSPGGNPYGDPATQQIANATWELNTQIRSVPLEAHPAFNTQVTSTNKSITVLEIIAKAVADHTAGGVDYVTLYPANGGESQSKFNDYRDEKIKGNDTYPAVEYVVRQTVQSAREDTFAVNLPIKPMAVIPWSAIGVPTGARFGQPYIVTWNGTTATATAVNQWLVMGPQCRWNGKIYELTQEWWGGISFSPIIYRNYVVTP